VREGETGNRSRSWPGPPGTGREAGLGHREPVEKLAWATGNRSRGWPGPSGAPITILLGRCHPIRGDTGTCPLRHAVNTSL
jgi:hypothetical protein